MTEIRKYTPAYKQAMKGICISTASEKARTDAKHHDFSLLMYCDEYLDCETALMLVDGEKAVGYILCAENYDTWKRNMAPYVEKIKAIGFPYDRIVEEEIADYGKYATEYPAHMHIDILEDYTGGGNGTRLFKALISILKEDHVKGLMLGVSASNKRAVSFYQKMGFSIINSTQYGYTMGMKL